VSTDDSLSTTRAVFKETNVSRVPVLKDGRVEGVINILDLLGPVYSAELDKRDNMPEDTKRLNGVLAASFMRKDFPTAEPDMPLSQVIDLMLQKRSAVIVEKGGRLAGMVTSGDLLKLLGREVKGAYVSISGFREEDDFLKDFIYEEIGNLLRKVNKIYPVNYLNAHLEKHFSDAEGKRIKYSFRVRLATGGGFFFAHDYAWDLTKAMKGALEKLDKEIIKRKERLANL
jgi:CBS domain-containing protein